MIGQDRVVAGGREVGIEVWSSEDEWKVARSSPAIAEWARNMPHLSLPHRRKALLSSTLSAKDCSPD
jgi:quinol monooxygenase YgiN